MLQNESPSSALKQQTAWISWSRTCKVPQMLMRIPMSVSKAKTRKHIDGILWIVKPWTSLHFPILSPSFHRFRFQWGSGSDLQQQAAHHGEGSTRRLVQAWALVSNILEPTGGKCSSGLDQFLQVQQTNKLFLWLTFLALLGSKSQAWMNAHPTPLPKASTKKGVAVVAPVSPSPACCNELDGFVAEHLRIPPPIATAPNRATFPPRSPHVT